MSKRALTLTTVATILAGCASRTPWAHATLAPSAKATRVVALELTRDGFEPAIVTVEAGETVRLAITRRVEQTCASRVILCLDADTRIERELPFDRTIAITLHFDAPGELGLSCPMNMYGATIEVR